MLALRLTRFDHLVDIGRVAELQGIERREDALWIGAGTTQAQVEASAEVASTVPLLAKATPFIGHFQIRNRGTLGGSIAHADPAAEYPAVALTLDAQHGGRIDARAAHDRGARLLRRPVEHQHRTRRAPRRRVVPDVGIAELGSRSRSSPGATATSRSRAPRSASSSTATTGSHAARSASSAWVRRPSAPARPRPSSPAARSRDIEPEEVGRLAMAGLTSVPDDLHGSAGVPRRASARRWWRARVDDGAAPEALDG